MFGIKVRRNYKHNDLAIVLHFPSKKDMEEFDNAMDNVQLQNFIANMLKKVEK